MATITENDTHSLAHWNVDLIWDNIIRLRTTPACVWHGMGLLSRATCIHYVSFYSVVSLHIWTCNMHHRYNTHIPEHYWLKFISLRMSIHALIKIRSCKLFIFYEKVIEKGNTNGKKCRRRSTINALTKLLSNSLRTTLIIITIELHIN